MTSKIIFFVENDNKALNTENTKRMSERDKASIIAIVLLISRIPYFFPSVASIIPLPGIEPGPWRWESQILTTGQHGRNIYLFLECENNDNIFNLKLEENFETQRGKKAENYFGITFFGILSNRAYFTCCIAKSIHTKGFYRQFCSASLAQRFCSPLVSSDHAGSICWLFVTLFIFFILFFFSTFCC